MRVLWITNILLPEMCELLHVRKTVIGGWMESSAKQIAKSPEIELAIATTTNQRKLRYCYHNSVHYFFLPYSGKHRYNKKLEKEWLKVKEEFCPDIVHIHGSEFAHGLAYIRANGPKGVVVSIQGLVSQCAKYYRYGLKSWDILRNVTMKDFLVGGIFRNQKSFRKRGKYEIEMLNAVSYIIGRTDWDRAHTWAINPSAIYYPCNETLREVFYKKRWRYSQCERYSIFLSQANDPFKGLHQLLKALPLILKFYPNTKVYIAGKNIIQHSTFQDVIRYSGYGRMINNFIKKYNLENIIYFVGNLDAGKMATYLCKSNAFLLPSSIENSPNSLGEAQLIGVPCVVAHVGGTLNMIPNDNCGYLYRYEDTEMLAYYICEIFRCAKSFDNTEMRRVSLERHNPHNNMIKLLNIYKSICMQVQ